MSIRLIKRSEPTRPSRFFAWSGVSLFCVLLAACGEDTVPAVASDDAGADAPGDAIRLPEAADAATDTAVIPDAPVAYARPTYTLLSRAGLYSDIASKTIDPAFTYFAP